MKHNTQLTAAPFVLFVTLCGCSSQAEVFTATNAELAALVGTPCVLPSEDIASYRGLTTDEVVVEEDEVCGTGLCVASNFRGRASCPAGGEAGECLTPAGEPVTVAVEPQLESRPAEEAMICSCRCSGSEAWGPLCACPDGFVCQHLVDDLGAATEKYAGGYCVKAD